MKAIKYLVAGLLVMGLAAPAMAQDVNYKDMLKPIETTLKAGNADPKAFAKEIKEYQKEFKKDPKALIALGNLTRHCLGASQTTFQVQEDNSSCSRPDCFHTEVTSL